MESKVLLKKALNTSIARTLLLVALLPLFIGGCAKRGLVPRTDLMADSILWKQYTNSIYQAAVFLPYFVEDLQPILTDSVTGVTWTKYASSYSVDDTTRLTYGDVWITIVPEVQSKCQTYPADSLDLRLQQLIGLPPDAEYTDFVVMRVAAKDIFRPCTNPAITTKKCNEKFPPGVSEAHIQWIARQMLSSYQSPGGYPWTRLGYTYDWNPGTGRYGASEYVIRKNSLVYVTAIDATATYCSPQ